MQIYMTCVRDILEITYLVKNQIDIAFHIQHVDSTLLRDPHIVVTVLIAPRIATLAARHIDGT